MILAALVAVASIAAGIALGLGGRRGSLGPLSSFAIVAALAVVLVQLLPDAIAGAGAAALGVFAAGLALPRLLELGIARVARRARPAVGLELSYAALLLHQVGDGLGLGTYAGGAHEGHSHFDVLLAISAHTVPLVALFTIAYHRRAGAGAAIGRGAGLAVAQLAGVGITMFVPIHAFAPIEPWATAAIAGLLVHVVSHDWQLDRRAPSFVTRAFSLAGIAAGALLVLVAGDGHDHGGGRVRSELLEALGDLALDTAPALLVGLIAGALLSAASGGLGARWLRGGSGISQAVRGAILGAPHPVRGGSVLPFAQSLRARGAGPALVVAFLLAAPGLGIDTFVLTTRFMGWPFAGLRAVAAIVIAIVAGLAVHASSGVGATDPAEIATSEQSYARRALLRFDELVLHVAPWTVLGLIAAAFVQVSLHASSFAGWPFGLDVLIVTIVAVTSYVCASAATPLGAVLLAKGMSPGAVLVGLLLGPAMNIASIGLLRRAYGARATSLGLGALLVLAWGFGSLANVWVDPIVSSDALPHEPHSALVVAVSIALVLVLLVSLWRHGVGGWLGSVAEGLGAPADIHADECEDPVAHVHEHHTQPHLMHSHDSHPHRAHVVADER